MQEVDGEDFLRGLYHDLNSKESILFKTSLSFTTWQLSFINHKLSDVSKGALRGQRLAHLAKKKPLNHNELLDFQYYLEQIGQLRVTSGEETLDETTVVDLAGFRGVRQLHVIRCKPNILYNISLISGQLAHLVVDRSIGSIAEILGNSPSQSDRPWGQLQVLNLAHNYITNMDDALLGLSVLEVLDLSHNLISRVENLQFCYCLIQVNLSHNRIKNVQNTVETFGNLRILNLSGNGLESVSGLEKLLGLERLDLSDNELMQPLDVVRLHTLPNLTHLELRGNPLTSIAKWRTQVYSYLLRTDLAIDGTLPSSSEKTMIETKRAEQPIVPYAGHSTISKVGTVETPKPAFGSGRALTSDFADPTYSYNYPALNPEDRHLMAEVAVTAPPLHIRPKIVASSSAAGSPTSSSPLTAAQIALKRKTKHPKRRGIADIADPADSHNSGTQQSAHNHHFGDDISLGPSQPKSITTDSIDEAAPHQRARDPANPLEADKEMGQILEWAAEDRWLLNYNAYRKRLEEQDAQKEAERQAELAAQATSLGSKASNSPSDALGVSSDSLLAGSPVPGLGESSSTLSSTPNAPGSGAIQRRKFLEVRRQTLLMPSTLTADMLAEMESTEVSPGEEEEFQKFAQSTMLRISGGKSQAQPVSFGNDDQTSNSNGATITADTPSPEAGMKENSETLPTETPAKVSTPPPTETLPESTTSPVEVPTENVVEAPKAEVSEPATVETPARPESVKIQTTAPASDHKRQSSSEEMGEKRSLRMASTSNAIAPVAVPEPSANPFEASFTAATSGAAPNQQDSLPTAPEATPQTVSVSSPPMPISEKLTKPKSSKYKFNNLGADAMPSGSPQIENEFTDLLAKPELDKSDIGSLTMSAEKPVAKPSKLAVGGTSITASSSEILPTDEYLVSTPSATDASIWEERILIVNTKSLEEWDTQGSVVMKLEAKELVDVSVDSGEPVVELSYGNINPRSFSPHSTLVYKMDSSDDVSKLVKTMKGILGASSKKIKCMSCQSVFTMQKMLECAKCGGSSLMVFESGQTSNETENPIPSSTSFGSLSSVPHVEDTMDATVIPMNRQIYTRTMHLKDESDHLEEMLAYFPCWLVVYNSAIQKEQRASVVISETKFMLFIKRRARKGSVLAFGKTGKEGVPSSSEEDYKNEELFVSVKLESLRRVVAGPFWQWFRVESTVNNEAFVIVTRSHARTFRFLQFFKKTCGWLEMSNKNLEFSTNLKSALQTTLKDTKSAYSNASLSVEIEDFAVDLYFMAYQRIKSGFTLFSNPRSSVMFGKDSTLTPRSIILTKHNILICEEDYAKWPSLAVPGWSAPKTPQFTILQHFSYHEIVSLATSHPQEHPNHVSLTFEYNTSHGSTSQQQIVLITQGEGERTKFIQLISDRYQEYFHIKLIPEQST